MDLEIVYIERIAGRRAVKVLTRVGGRFALHATGVGLVLLAHALQEVQERVLAADLERWTDMTITDPATLRACLAEVRRDGYALSRSQVTMDALSLACPIRAREDSVVAALSIVVHADVEHPLGLLPSLRAASRSISRALGSPGARIHHHTPKPASCTSTTGRERRNPTSHSEGSVPQGRVPGWARRPTSRCPPSSAGSRCVESCRSTRSVPGG